MRGNKQLYGYFTSWRTRANSRARLSRGSTGGEGRGRNGITDQHRSEPQLPQTPGNGKPGAVSEGLDSRSYHLLNRGSFSPFLPLSPAAHFLLEMIAIGSNNNMLCTRVFILLLSEISTPVMSVPHVLVQGAVTSVLRTPPHRPAQPSRTYMGVYTAETSSGTFIRSQEFPKKCFPKGEMRIYHQYQSCNRKSLERKIQNLLHILVIFWGRAPGFRSA